MGIALGFLLFTIVFVYFMDKWSREFEAEFDMLDEVEPAPMKDNVVLGNFARITETKRAA